MVNIPVNKTIEILLNHVFNFSFSVGITNSRGKLHYFPGTQYNKNWKD